MTRHTRPSGCQTIRSTAPPRSGARATDGPPLVTTDFVVDETLTLIRLRLGLGAAGTWWQQIDGSPRLRWERIDSDRFEKARQLFFQYRDKDFSFTDCTSFVTMREARLTHAITTDRHFRQMGFDVLPTLRSRAREDHTARKTRGPTVSGAKEDSGEPG